MKFVIECYMKKFGIEEFVMDKISLLQKRKKVISDAGKEIRKIIKSLIDEDSFVEFSCYSFYKNEFYGENAEGE